MFKNTVYGKSQIIEDAETEGESWRTAVLCPVLRLIGNYKANATSWVRNVTLIARNNMNVKLPNCLPCCWAVIQANIECVGLRVE